MSKVVVGFVLLVISSLAGTGCDKPFEAKKATKGQHTFHDHGINDSHDDAAFAKSKAQGKTAAEIEIPERRDFPQSETVSPCDDFYQYSCGPVIEKFEMPTDRTRWAFSFNDSAERILRLKKKLLASPDAGRTTARAQQYISYYNSCINEDARREEEKSLVANQLATLEALKKQADPKNALLKVLGENVATADMKILSFFAENNQKNSNQWDLVFDVDFKTLSDKSYYLDLAVMKDYREVVVAFFKAIGRDQAQARADRILKFESEFAKISPSRAEMRNIWTRDDAGVSRSDLLAKYPNLKFETLLQKVPPQTFIRNLVPDVYAYANAQLEKISFDDLADIIAFRELHGELELSQPAFYELQRQFLVKHMGEPAVRAALDERCTLATMEAFEREIDETMYSIVFPSFPEKNFRNTVEKIRSTMVSKLKKNTWLQKETKKIAVEKLKAIGMQVVRPQAEKDWNFVPLRSYGESTFLANQETYTGAILERTLSLFGKPADKNVWQMGPLTVNAYFSPSESKFVMPAGILQYPFYDAKGSELVNLAAVGFVVGHEVGHSFDDQGSLYDKNGNKNPWMKEADLAKFKELSQKIDAQMIAACKRSVENLDKITVADSSTTPTKEELYKICEDKSDPKKNYAELTRGENIGDLAGLHFAYETAFPKGKGTVEAKREFFHQYGKVWCSKITKGAYLKRLREDVHAQVPMRTNEPLVHLDGFYEAFKCKAGDKMFLPKEQRVDIW